MGLVWALCDTMNLATCVMLRPECSSFQVGGRLGTCLLSHNVSCYCPKMYLETNKTNYICVTIILTGKK